MFVVHPVPSPVHTHPSYPCYPGSCFTPVSARNRYLAAALAQAEEREAYARRQRELLKQHRTQMLVNALNRRLQRQQDNGHGEHIPRRSSFLDGSSLRDYGCVDYCPRPRTLYSTDWSCPYSGYGQDIEEAALSQAADVYDYMRFPQVFSRGYQEQPASHAPVETKPAPASVPSKIPVKASESKGKSKQVDAIEPTEFSAESETDSEAERAADPRAIQASLTTISELDSYFEKLENEFIFPDELDFESPSEGSTDLKFAYTSRNAPVRYYDHALQELLSNLDAISSFGSKTVREKRKALVEKIERSLERLEKEIEKNKELSIWKMNKTVPVTLTETDDAAADKTSDPADTAFPENLPEPQTIEEAEVDQEPKKDSAAVDENVEVEAVNLTSPPEGLTGSQEVRGEEVEIDAEMVVVGSVDVTLSENPSKSQSVEGDEVEADGRITLDVEMSECPTEPEPAPEVPAESSVDPPSEPLANSLSESSLLTRGPELDAVTPDAESELSEWVSTTLDGPASSSSRTATTLDDDVGSSSPVPHESQFPEIAMDPSSSEDNTPVMSERVQLSQTNLSGSPLASQSPLLLNTDAFPMSKEHELDTFLLNASSPLSPTTTSPPFLPVEEDAVLVEAPDHEDEQEDAWVDVEA